jgi:endonuclease/exonuclease/phosphatase family metal-dependent hydrolase
MASHPSIVLRLLTWNVFHGRDFPPAGAATHVDVRRSLRAELGATLARWEWDVALLQEAPPRWLAPLERACRAAGVRDLTSRNSFGRLSGWLADRWPDLIKSWEGGSNMLLVRPPARIVATRAATLTRRPERRRLLMVRVELASGQRLVVANVHLSVPSTRQGAAEAALAARLATEWAGGDPVVLGGDLNLRPRDHRAAFDDLRDRFGLAAPTGPRAIDHLLARGLDLVERPQALPAAAREVTDPGGLAIRLSDHAPVVAAFGVR